MAVSEKHAEINLRFEFVDHTRLEEAAQQIEARLRRLEAVNDVEAMPSDMRFSGAEVVAVVAVTAMVVRSGRDVVAEIRKLVTEVKALLGDLRDLKNVYVDIGNKRVPIDKLDAQALQELGS
ncbi:MAG: hypothetical protein ACRD44_12970 [Bryobacteraceae bacterium]